MKRTLLGHAAVASAALLAIPTAAQAPGRALPTGISKEELYGSMLRNSRWKRLKIEVCWLAPPSEESDERAIVRKAVADTWEKASKIRFEWTETCPGTSKGIRIRVADTAEAPHVDWIGRFVDGRPEGMFLNFSFVNWGSQCQSNRESCIHAIAVHEFGHALGFTHEQNRPEAPDWCKEKKQGAVGDYNVTDYDPSSIMNYCNEHWNGNGQLSKLDRDAVRTVYGSG